MKPVLIIRTGQAPAAIRSRHGDFPHWFRLATRLRRERVQVVDVAAGEVLPPVHEVAGTIVTGSSAMVTARLPWSEHTAGWIRDAMDAELPLFGVCYGHQLMAQALGGRVDYLPGGREIGTQPIEPSPGHERDPLTRVLRGSFRAHTTHEQSVLEPPPDAIILARSARDPHHLLRYGPSAVSVQFHPEFNAEVMRAYIRRRRTDLRGEGADPERIFNAVAATPMARRLLRQFARLHGWTESA